MAGLSVPDRCGLCGSSRHDTRGGREIKYLRFGRL